MFLLLLQVIQKIQNLTSKTDDPPSPAILAIYLDQAQDLPVRFPRQNLRLRRLSARFVRGVDEKRQQGPEPDGADLHSGHNQREQGDAFDLLFWLEPICEHAAWKRSPCFLQTCYGTNNPIWSDAFTFFIQDPRKQDIDIQVSLRGCFRIVSAAYLSQV